MAKERICRRGVLVSNGSTGHFHQKYLNAIPSRIRCAAVNSHWVFSACVAKIDVNFISNTTVIAERSNVARHDIVFDPRSKVTRRF
jgi:hypothetical protein